ncbi:hypothetical protein HPB48_011813 [Haemaphysalis longicornis]|uniref:Uncharacterized protein n=1 Tax=Haemaphysalis longicornis TaxID=44386 RepID=A0A9J6GU81_HAELO|nr:hypothetical protein HPB48_011813 [Haemaphysalis longicornis]
MKRKPDVDMIPETLCTDTPTLQGYRAHTKATKRPNENTKKFGIRKPAGGGCTFVCKGIVFLEHELTTGGCTDSSAVEVIVGKKKRKTSLLAVNVYSKPRHRTQKFRTLMQRALRATNKAASMTAAMSIGGCGVLKSLGTSFSGLVSLRVLSSPLAWFAPSSFVVAEDAALHVTGPIITAGEAELKQFVFI